MIKISSEFAEAVKDPNRVDCISGTIVLNDGSEVTITDDIVESGSVQLKEQLCSGDAMEIGTFYTNELDITVYEEDYLSNKYAGAKINPYYGIRLPSGEWEDIPLGEFWVDNTLTKRKGKKQMLVAFDASVKFDIDCTGSLTTATPWGFIGYACAAAKVEISPDVDYTNLPNYNEQVTIASASIQTYRDLVEWCAQLMGCSSKIDRYGKFTLVQLREKTDENGYLFDAVISGDERFGTEFFDLRALVKYVSTTINGEPYIYTRNATLDDDVGRNATVTVDENPLLKNKPNARELFNNSVSGFSVVLRSAEFKFSGNPAIECFDTVGVYGGQIDNGRTMAIFPTQIIWKYRGGETVKCAFAELTDEKTTEKIMTAANEATPAPVKVKSKTDKRIDGLTFDAFNAGGVGKFANDEKNSEIFNDYTGNTATAEYIHVEGEENGCSAYGSHVEGHLNSADNGMYSHVEGGRNTVTGSYNHIEGSLNTGTSNYTHVEGEANTIKGGSTHHVEGYANHIAGDMNHLEGSTNTVTLGARNHLEGWKNTVNGSDNHIENEGNDVIGEDNHASGYDNNVNGNYCAVFGRGNNISNDYNTVIGKYSVNKDLAFRVGIGTSNTDRKNGFELDWDGNLRVEGDVIARNISPISISDSIDENSTNDRAAGGKAVYDFVTTYASPIGNVELQAIIDLAVG